MASDPSSTSLFTSRRAPVCGLLLAVLTASLALTLPGLPEARAQESSANKPPTGPDPTALFNSAVTSFGNGDYQGAITNIDNLLKQIPGDLPPEVKVKYAALLEPIYFTLGAAYFNLKKFPEAITAINDYLKRYPKSTRVNEATFSLAQASFFNKDYETAAKGFANLENVPAYREQALLLEGLSYKEANQGAKAIAPLERLTGNGIKSPTAARGAMQLVLIYSSEKQPEKALKMLSNVQANIDYLENVVELNSVALEQGDAYLQSNQNKEALVCYRAVRTREQVIAIEHARIAALQKQLEANKIAARADPKQALAFFTVNKQLQDSVNEDQQLVDNFEKLPPIYAKVLYRMGRAFYQMTRPWESTVAYQDSYDRSTDPADREPALFGIITAFADVSQAAIARAECDKYLKEFPQGTNAFTVGYLLGATALQDNDPKAAESYFGRMLSEQPNSTLREEMRFLLANAQFAQGKYDEARAAYAQYRKEFPQGTHIEEAVYRTTLSYLFGGDYDNALKGEDEYLKQYPSGAFVSDCRYRRGVCKYAANKYDEVIAEMKGWIKDYPNDPQQGEVEALLGDAYVALGRNDEALAAYQISFKTATTDEVLNYSINEAGKILQKKGDWEADAAMFTDFVKAKPDHPTAVMALSQIGRAKAKLGKVDEAKHFLADTLKKYIDDVHRDSVEQILDQLAQLCVRKKPAVVAVAVATASPGPSASPGDGSTAVAAATPVATPTPTPEVVAETPTDPGAELDDLLGASLKDNSPTAQARILYAKAELAKLRRQYPEQDKNLLAIAAKFKPHDLPATILGQVGDTLLAKGKLDEAAPFYEYLLENYSKSDNVDFAYAGLGEIAFQKKQYQKALDYFKDGTDKIAANLKLKELTVGQGKALLALGKLDEAKKIFEQCASVREWRGETTAFCVYSLGEIESKQGHWAEANAYYQRVFVAYQRFLPWVAKSYLGSAASLEKLGKKEDAVKTYQEMLRNQKLADFSETTEARQRLQALGAG